MSDKQDAIRFSKEMRDEIERYRAKKQKADPGQRVTFSDAVRSLVKAGLSAKGAAR
jgi:hypothetical protein